MCTKYIKVCFLAALIVYLNGCTIANVDQNYSLEKKDDTGLVIVSLSRSSVIESDPSFDFDFLLELRGVDSSFIGNLPIKDRLGPLDWKGDCDFKSSEIYNPIKRNVIRTVNYCKGRLAVFEMEKGDYEIYKWRVKSKTPYGNYDRVEGVSREFSMRFTVIPKKAVYLGNINIVSKLDYGSLSGFVFIVAQDRRIRDLKIFHERYPKISSDKLDIELINTPDDLQ